MKRYFVAFAVAASLGAAPAIAAEGADLFKAKGCANCHDASAKKVGPSVKDVSAKYKGKDTKAVLAKLKEGTGHMKVAASDAEIKAMVDYMVSGK